jgi:hypothetical protein
MMDVIGLCDERRGDLGGGKREKFELRNYLESEKLKVFGESAVASD